jgi:error-prone DNA polymerase
MAYAELHCHTNFSFLDGASAADDLVERAIELGLSGLAVTDHGGLYGVVRFVAAAEAAGLRPIVGVEVELAEPAVPDPAGIVVPPRRARGERARGEPAIVVEEPVAGLPARLRSNRPRLPGHRPPLRPDLRGVADEERGPHLVLLARSQLGYRSLCRLISRANLAGTKGVPRLDHALLEAHAEGLVALSGCRHGEIARRLVAGDRAGARAAAERYARIFGAGDSLAAAGFVLELEHHLLPDDDWRVAETVDLAAALGLPVVVTNDVHYARPEDRELHDVLTAIRHGRTLETLGPLRSPSGEGYLKSEAELAALPPSSGPPRVARAWRAGLAAAAELAATCSVDLGFEAYRFPGFPVPPGETPFSYLSNLCWEGARRRYHPLTPAVVRQLAHELEVIERTGLAEFFLICWDLMAFARRRGIPAQGRGSAADSIVAYVLGITRVDPIRHNLLFERFINEGRTTYPDVDIDFSAARREEVIQYVYERYGAEHTGMVCNVVTYRARSAVREVGLALGFPRPFVDRVAKAVETYDSVMVRRDLEADGGFAHLFRRAVGAAADGGPGPAAIAAERGLVDRMGRVARPTARRSDPLRDGPGTDLLGRPLPHSSVARLAPEPAPAPRGGSTVGWSDWERWLELCARLDGFPRHLSIHTGGMLVTAAPLVDIAPLERATMPGRVVVQYDKRDVETLKLIKLDLLGLGMLAAIDETLAWIEHDCGVCLDLDRLPEDIPEIYAMLAAADTVGVFQVESRAQMQTLPKTRPRCLDDLVVEVAIIRPGPIQGNAVHPYLRRRQGLEPVTYLHPSLEPILAETLGVILYQEQVMRIAIEVAGFSAAEADGFRRAMGTWRSRREMEKLHARFVEGCIAHRGLERATAEELFRQVAAFASFGFAKSHAAAFARTAYESAFLKCFYPAQFLVGLVNAQPMGFYPVEVLVNDAKRHGVAVLPVDVNASAYRTTTEWVGRPGWVLAGAAGDDGSRDAEPGEPLPPGCGIAERPRPVRSAGCLIPSAAARARWAAESARGWGVRLGLHLVTGLGEEYGARIEAARAEGPFRDLLDVVERTDLPEELLERLIRAGALDSFGRPRRALLWELREVAGEGRRRATGAGRRRTVRLADSTARSLPLGLPPTPAPELPPLSEVERLGDAYAVVGLDPKRQVVELFRPALDRLGVVRAAALGERPMGTVRIAGLVVTRQHPMTARGTVFLALE